MTRLLVALLAVAAAYWVGRDVEWRAWMRDKAAAGNEPDTEHDGSRWKFSTDSNLPYTTSPPRYGTFN